MLGTAEAMSGVLHVQDTTSSTWMSDMNCTAPATQHGLASHVLLLPQGAEQRASVQFLPG